MDYKALTEEILDCLKKKDQTIYWIAKTISEKRTGGKSPANRYHSAISRALNKPQESKLKTIVDIVEVLGGQVTINWEGETKTTKYIYVNAPYEVITDSYEPDQVYPS